MPLSKKVLIGSLIGLATTTIVVGTAIGISVNKTVNTSSNTSNETNASTNANSEVDLTKLISSINKSSFLIKKDNDIKNLNEVSSNLYAFNVLANELIIKKDTFPNSIKVDIQLNDSLNTAKSLNEGKLSVEVSLKDEASNEQKTTIELDGFKAVDVKKDFAGLFEDETNFIFKIEVEKQDSFPVVRYTNIDYLNEDNVPLVRLTNPNNRLTSLSISESGTGLSSWLGEDKNKRNLINELSIEGKVKLDRFDLENQTTYFYLKSKDINNKLKLIRKKDNETKEVAIEQIKTTNLLATDISIIPTTLLDETQQEEYINAIKQVSSTDQKNKYLVDKKDEKLNREIYVELDKDSKEGNEINKLYLKPYITNWPITDTKQIDLYLKISFGSFDNAVSFSTNNEKDIEALKKAGFKFGLYTKKLTDNENVVNPTFFENKKADLMKYFTEANYWTVQDRTMIKSNGKYPAEFNLVEINDQYKTNFHLNLAETSQLQNSQNWLAFVDYSYTGIEANKVLFTPSINLIKVVTKTPVQ